MTAFESVWQMLDEPTREWLIAHNGEPLPAPVLAEIRGEHRDLAGIPWLQRSDDEGWTLTDEAVDWVEEFANGEDEGTN